MMLKEPAVRGDSTLWIAVPPGIETLVGRSRLGISIIRSPPACTIDQLTRDYRLGDFLASYESVSLHLRGSHAGYIAPIFQFHFQPQLITGADRPAKFRALDSSEDHDLVAVIDNFPQQQRSASLRNCFHDQNARHDRQPGKVPHKERLVDGDVLDGNDPFPALQFEDAVNEQKRVAVWQNLQDLVDVEAGLRLVERRFRNRATLIHGSSQNSLKIILYGLCPKLSSARSLDEFYAGKRRFS